MFESFGVINYYSFVAAAIAIVILPGPTSMYVLALAGKHGIKSAYKAALGIFLVDALIMLITGLGASSILKVNPFTLRSVGGSYLGILIFRIFINTVEFYKQHKLNVSSNNYPYDLESKIIKQNKSNFFKTALYISLINQKAILFLLIFFVHFINPLFQIWKPFILLGITLQIISFFYLSLIIFAGIYLSNYFRKHIFLSYAGSVFVGILFIFFAYKLFIGSL